MFVIRHYVDLVIPHYMSGGNPPNNLTRVFKSFGGFYVPSSLLRAILLNTSTYLLFVYSLILCLMSYV